MMPLQCPPPHHPPVTVSEPRVTAPVALLAQAGGEVEMTTAAVLFTVGACEIWIPTLFSVPSHTPAKLHITHDALQAVSVGSDPLVFAGTCKQPAALHLYQGAHAVVQSDWSGYEPLALAGTSTHCPGTCPNAEMIDTGGTTSLSNENTESHTSDHKNVHKSQSRRNNQRSHVPVQATTQADTVSFPYHSVFKTYTGTSNIKTTRTTIHTRTS